jgi:hypothetical protein
MGYKRAMNTRAMNSRCNPKGMTACEFHVDTTVLVSRGALFRIRIGERVHVEASQEGEDACSARDDEAVT